MGFQRGLACAEAALFTTAAPAAAQVDPLLGVCGPQGDSAVSENGPCEILPQEVVEIPSTHDGRAIQIGIVRPMPPDGKPKASQFSTQPTSEGHQLP